VALRLKIMTKTIGIPSWRTGDNSFGIGISYLQFITKFGAVPVFITPENVENPPTVDLLLLPGGADLLPSTYGAKPGYRTLPPNIFLEYFDAHILPKYIDNKTPIFAVCRGAQRIWTMFGGLLDQDNSRHAQSKHQYDQCHELYFTKDYSNWSTKIKKVTSRHHQCCNASNPDTIPEELDVIAFAEASYNKPDTSVVEIFCHKTLAITGVQFHPEDHDGTDQLSSLIIKNYLDID
jgi:putative glutamine amidotransferase